MRSIRRGGPYLRIAEPGWADPLDGGFAAQRGGRWNPPESFAVVYLCRSLEVARASGPVLVRTTVPEDRYLNVITDAGCRDAGLPATYPLDSRRRIVPWRRCQPIGLRTWEAGVPGVAARSAATGGGGEELAYFGQRKLRRGAVRSFEDWFWADAPLR